MDTPRPDTPGETTPSSVRAGFVVSDRRWSSIVTGALLVVLGAIFLIDRVGWQWGWHLSFARLWPVLLIVAGIGTSLSHVDQVAAPGGSETGATPVRRRRRYGDGVFLTLVGVLMLLHVNHWLRLQQSWPLFVVAAGLSMVFGGGRRERRSRRDGR